ncbi:MAG: sensor histidine kinase [Lachnospiraceae bacterium]|nr:sensor histidine kinase [Lachnospiraceae bacterium]
MIKEKCPLAGVKEPHRWKWQSNIRSAILFPFSLVSLLGMLILAVAMYYQFTGYIKNGATENATLLLEQAVVNLESYLSNMRRMSDAMYYDVIKSKDLAEESVDDEMNLMYESNKDELVSFALFDSSGELLSAAPNAVEKTGVSVRDQSWYRRAMSQVENLHFSNPHVENIFEDNSFRYYWVISLSRNVELTVDGVPRSGVLLVDMNYSTIEQMLSKVNRDNSQQYVYLCDRNGTMIYHPAMMQISTGMYEENNSVIPTYEDGVHNETFNGEKRIVVVDTVSYTGWKLVSVIPLNKIENSYAKARYTAFFLGSVVLLFMIILNQVISARVASPLIKLDESIKKIEAGNIRPDIYIGGPYEVAHLGRTLRDSFDQINRLMDDVVTEQEEKRKSELDALQSQINPHFLYNTLDSIVWMIEGQRYDDAVFMITQLASLFRISLSKGKTIVPLKDEFTHAENYMNIQKIRFKNQFAVKFDVPEEIGEYCTVKLILQPILENAIYYGVKDMDEEGEILVTACLEKESVVITVSDNGFGIPEDQVELLLTDDKRVRKHGSGVGLVNIHSRIRLRFGEAYGLRIESEPDEGTKVHITLPAVLYTEVNQKMLERGEYRKGGKANEE